MKITSLILILLSLSCSMANTDKYEELDNRVQTVVNHCKTCHSTKEMQRGPLLEGLEVWYMEETLESFKSGIRGGNKEDIQGQLMYSAVKDLPEEDIIAAVKWFAGQPRPEIKAFIKGDVKAGQKLYKEACFGCHEHTMGKLFSRSPDLYKLEDWYIFQQLRGFKSKIRGSHPEDSHGLSMQGAAQNLSVQDMKNVAAYLATFQEKP